ncbi:MAG: hypothetical protein IPJ66_10925 [Bacteroidetes bacterium]|nr:hypothetical protein [Bacteroidota bacterium]MBL0137057.1 hypothetical protein [Bacteroidota bacterium]
MKRILKKMSKIILGLLVLVVLFMLGSYWYITTEWKKYYTEDEIKSFVKEIDKAPKLSDTFYGVYDKLHNNDRHKSITSIYTAIVWNKVIMDNNQSQNQNSWYVSAAYYFPKKRGMRDYADFKLAWGLEKFTTPEKCFDFAMSIENEQLIRYKTAMINITVKNISQLSDTTEILEYLVISSAPTFYGRNPERLNQRIAELRMKLD